MTISENSTDLYVQLPLLTLFKIAIIAFTGFTLFANFYPYYTDVDSLFYGVNTLAIAEGNYEYTNDLLKETGKWEFIPVQWTKSIHNTAIPTTSVGFFAFSTPAFLIGGFPGLFYLGPIIAVALLIVSERVSTKLFGKYVGLFTVVLLATDFLVYRMGQQLMTDNLFTIFIILGFYYLIIFLHNKKSSFILFSSIFLTIATFIRPTSIVFLSSEIFILAGYSLFHIYQNTRNISHSNLHYFNKVLFFKKIYSKIKSKKFFKIAILMLIPWVVFVSFYFSYNDYYFGDSTTNYISVRQDTLADRRDPISLFFTLDSERFEFIKSYSVSLLPDSIRSILLDFSGNNSMSFLESNWLSIFSFIIFGTALLLSIYDKNKRIEIFSLSFFVLSFLAFLSSPYIAPTLEHPPNNFLADRYMIPMLAFSFMAFGFSLFRVIIPNMRKFSIEKNIISKRLSVSLLVVLIIFLVISINDSPQVKHLTLYGFHFKDPFVVADRFPIDREGLKDNNIIVGGWSSKTMEYNAIPFFPYWDWGRYESDTTLIPQEPIHTLKEIMNDGYETFIFKGGVSSKDSIYYKYLEEEHSIIYQNFSKTFCKMVLIENTNEINIQENLISDDTCYERPFSLFPTNQIIIGNRTIQVEIVGP